MRAGLLLLAVLSLPAWAGERVLIAPVQNDRAVVAGEVAVDIEEAVRSGVLRRAADLGLDVMSHASLARSLDDLHISGRDTALALPCTTASCDAAVGRALGTGLTVSTRLGRRGDTMTITVQLIATTTAAHGAVVASGAAEAASVSALLTAAQRQAELLFTATTTTTTTTTTTATATPGAQAAPRVVRSGQLQIAREPDVAGARNTCTLTTADFSCVGSGAKGARLSVPLTAFRSVTAQDGVVVVVTSRSRFRLRAVEASASATDGERLAERARLDADLAAWATDLDVATGSP